MAKEALIERYEQGIRTFEAALKGLPQDMLDRRPAPDKWSIREIAVHLVDSELVTAARLRWVAAEPGIPLKGFDQDKWAAKLGYGSQSTEQTLELFRALRRTTATMLRSLPESAWSQTGMHEERGEVSLQKFVELYTAHAEHHAAQIKELRDKFAAAAKA